MNPSYPLKTYAPLLKFSASAALARREFKDFVQYTKPDYQFNWHHISICDKLNEFSRGSIKKLMIFVPPQHGKSELATRRYPAFQLGVKPTSKIAICSYSDTLAKSFNRDIQRIIDDTSYHEVFPDTYLNESNVVSTAKGTYLRNSDIFETVNYGGFVKTVGVGGSLTGTPVDIGIIDDPFKDREEAMSVRIREKVYSWYTDVFKTRLDNHSKQLLIMTRWHEDDLAGKILADETGWEVVKYQAIKERETEGDPRQIGDVLWPGKHSLERILHVKKTNPYTFNSLYQQEPKASSESLVIPVWDEYTDDPGYQKVIAIDFGFSNDPTAIIEVQKHNKDLWARELVYKRGMVNSEIVDAIKALGANRLRGVADSAEPKSIEDLKRAGIQVIPAQKGPGSVNAGINWILDHNLHIHKDSHNLKNELINYQWLTFGGQVTNEPIDAYNHLIDALRYSKTLFVTNSNSYPTFIR